MKCRHKTACEKSKNMESSLFQSQKVADSVGIQHQHHPTYLFHAVGKFRVRRSLGDVGLGWIDGWMEDGDDRGWLGGCCFCCCRWCRRCCYRLFMSLLLLMMSLWRCGCFIVVFVCCVVVPSQSERKRMRCCSAADFY